MATWKCPICNWDNAEKWTACAKCNSPKLSASDMPIINPLREEIHHLMAEIDNQKKQASRKWEYFQITSEQIKTYGGLNSLGAQGWELIAATSYSEGGGMAIGGVGSSSYIVKVLYLFKREIPALPPDLEVRWQNVMSRIPKKYLPIIMKLEGIPWNE